MKLDILCPSLIQNVTQNFQKNIFKTGYVFKVQTSLILGRCARAGRSGVSYSLVAPDEYAFLLDLHLFLGKPLSISTAENKNGTIGRIPRSLLEEQHSYILSLHNQHADLVS